MSNRVSDPRPPSDPRFYSVSEVAQIFGMSRMTIYRAIHDDQLPAVRVRGRLFIPSGALDAMVEAACAKRTTDAATDRAGVAR